MQLIKNARFNGWTEPVGLEPPPFPPEFYAEYRLVVFPATVVESVGSEVIIFINDPTEEAYALSALAPLQLQVTMGMLETGAGVVGYVIFSVPKPDGSAEPFAAWEQYLDPHNPEMLQHFEDLAAQSHWHVVITGPGPEVLNVMEFANVYEMQPGLERLHEFAKDIPTTDFGAAIAAVQQNYDIAGLYYAGFSRNPSLADNEDPMTAVLEALREYIRAKNRDEVRSIGEKLNEVGGMEMMALTHRAYTEKYGDAGTPRLLEAFWSGVGQWQA